MKKALALLAFLAVAACGNEGDFDAATEPEAETTERTTTTEESKTTLQRIYDGDIAAHLQSEIQVAESLGFIELLDAGHTLTIDGGSGFGVDTAKGLALDYVVPILDALEMPESVWAKMQATRALDGTQSDSWDQFTATWTYHPDNGLDLIIEEP